MRGTAVFVCPVCPLPPHTGTKKRSVRLMEAAAAAGARPLLVTSDPAAEQQRGDIESRGWGLEVVVDAEPGLRERAAQHLRRRPSPYLPRLAGRLRELAAQGPAWIQLEHGQTGYYLRELAGARTVWSLHNLDSELLRTIARGAPSAFSRARGEVRWRAMRATERREAPRAGLVLCVSSAEQDALDAAGARTVLAPNGVDAELFAPRPVERRPAEVLFFGQLRYEPNHRGLLRFLAEGWPEVRAGCPGSSLRIVGEGAPEELRRAAAAADGVTLVGLVADIGDELARATLTVVPVWEGAGTRLKVLEALAAGCPVVATPLGAGGIGFEADRHGALAPTGRELGQSTAALLADPARREALAAEGRRLAEGFRWEETLREIRAHYTVWAQSDPPPGPG